VKKEKKVGYLVIVLALILETLNQVIHTDLILSMEESLELVRLVVWDNATLIVKIKARKIVLKHVLADVEILVQLNAGMFALPAQLCVIIHAVQNVKLKLDMPVLMREH
jgi:hypothetical protein